MSRRSDDKVVIDLDDKHDRRKWRCPVGHISWEPTNYHFWCAQCSRANWNHDPEFEELRNSATGETFERDQVKLVTEMGHYKALYKAEA